MWLWWEQVLWSEQVEVERRSQDEEERSPVEVVLWSERSVVVEQVLWSEQVVWLWWESTSPTRSQP